MTEGRPQVRIRTSSDRKKAMQQYDELRRSGQVENAVVIAQLKGGHWQVLGQGMSPDQIREAILVAVQALELVDAERTKIQPEPHEMPVSWGEQTRGTLPPRAITKTADGLLVPPPGENFVSCGECHHPRWYVLHNDVDELPSRYSCGRCGNEVVMHRIMHEGGRA